MKNIIKTNFFSCLIFLALTGIVYAGSISGTISYDGIQTGTIYVVAFNSPLSCSPPNPDQPSAVTTIPALGDYSLPGVPDGTYYIASIIMTCGDGCGPQLQDPCSIYGGCDTTTPIVITGNNSVENLDLSLVDGTPDNPNPFYEKYDLSATALHNDNGYSVWLAVKDAEHNALSVNVSGPGLVNTTDLVYDGPNGRWILPTTLFFGATPPATPIYYNFSITDGDGSTPISNHKKTDN